MCDRRENIPGQLNLLFWDISLRMCSFASTGQVPVPTPRSSQIRSILRNDSITTSNHLHRYTPVRSPNLSVGSDQPRMWQTKQVGMSRVMALQGSEPMIERHLRMNLLVKPWEYLIPSTRIAAAIDTGQPAAILAPLQVASMLCLVARHRMRQRRRASG